MKIVTNRESADRTRGALGRVVITSKFPITGGGGKRIKTTMAVSLKKGEHKRMKNGGQAGRKVR